MSANSVTNKLFYGDNLHVLRESVADASVDLIYLDPPFNSKRDYMNGSRRIVARRLRVSRGRPR